VPWCSPGLAADDPLATWHPREVPEAAAELDLEGVAFGNGRWVVVGDDGIILSSPDGVAWSPEENPAGTPDLEDIAFGNGIFVAIGGNGVVLTSADGRQWARQSPENGGGREILHDETRFVVLAAGGFLSMSVDGVDWEYPPRVPQMYVDAGGIAFGNGTYVVAGYRRTGKPTDLWSSVGIGEWQFRDARSSENLFGAGYGLGHFVAVGQDATLITSPDGVEWTLRTVPHTGFIWDICASSNYLAAACQWGRVLTSPDAVEWTLRETGADGHLTDIGYGGETFVAVGWDGLIVQSEPVAPSANDEHIVLARPTLNGRRVELVFIGMVDQDYHVEETSDWQVWNKATNVTCTTSPVSITLPRHDAAARFYRIAKP
jgi:hypothetical protein